MRRYLCKLAFLAILSAAVSGTMTISPGLAAGKEHKPLEQSVVIKAPAKLVFEGIQFSRSSDPERRHLVSHQQDTALIDEKLPDLPVIGTAHLVYKEIEVPYKRIDYLLVSSDKFKAFEGSWELTPLDNGQETKVSLRSYSDLKICIPFTAQLSANSTIKDINRRLSNLKHWCDQHEGKEMGEHEQNIAQENTCHNHKRLAENHLHSRVHSDKMEAAPAEDMHEDSR